MATRCFTPILGKKIRVTKLDSCGNPMVSGTSCAKVVTSGFITLKLTAEVEKGADIITKKADGSICVNQKVDDSFKRFSLELDLCGVDPDLLAFMTTANQYQDYNGVTNGFTQGEGQVKNRFALEVWTGLSGAACPTGVQEASGYFLLPFVAGGIIDSFEVSGDKSIDFKVMGAYTKGGNNWGQGPYNVAMNANGVPSPLPTPLATLTHFLAMDTGVATPAAVCGCQTM